MHKGKCHCGAVEYQLLGEPLTCYACHCTDCQKESGSAFAMSMIVQRKDLHVSSGALAEDVYERGNNTIHRHHCRRCGISLWFSSEAMPDIAALKPGTLEDKHWFEPVAHLWTRSASPWLRLDADARQYEQQPDMAELLELWQSREQA